MAFQTKLILIIICLLSIRPNAVTQIYVAPDGNDTTNTGTIDSPYKTISKAISVITFGDTIYLRGGNYIYSSTISITKNGKPDSLYHLFAYESERPIFDFASQTSSDGIKVNGWYWYLKGIEVKNAYHNGIAVNGSYNIIENCIVHDNRNTGLQLGNGASFNQIINCDSYNNVDYTQGNADGFAPKLDVGTGNYFYGCRAWQNSDDGYDGYLRPSNNVTTIYEDCWCFMNGYLKDGSPSYGNGNGFKMGGSDDKTLMHNVLMIRCLSFNNRVKGFDQNNNKGSMTLYNCTAYNNGTNYGMGSAIYTDSGKAMTLINCVSLGSSVSIWSGAIQQTNSWMPPFSITAADFVSIDTTGVRGPRKADGSLPDLNFMHLAEGSQLIDAGTDIGLYYNGLAPDLGAYEFVGPDNVNTEPIKPLKYVLKQNYPNPFNPSTTISYQIGTLSHVTLKIFDVLGREISILVNREQSPGEYTIQWNAERISAGTYFYRLTAGPYTETRKLLLLK